MKSLEEIKDDYAAEHGRDSWEEYFAWLKLCHTDHDTMQYHSDRIAERYATEKQYHGSVASLAKAADNAFENDFGIYSPDYIRKRITSPDNIVTL